jgi:hypothetical protein
MSADAIDAAREARGGLTFDWKRSASRPFWLMFFLVISVAGHVVCFSLFRVVYPPQKRELIQSLEVTVLDPSDPLTRDVLSRIDDRAVVLDARSALDLPGLSMAESEVRFQPFFQNYRPQLRELPPFGSGGSAPLLPPGSVVLPPIAGATAATPPAITAPLALQPIVEFRWQDEAREIVEPFDWSPVTPVQRPAEIDQTVLYIGIDRFGHVLHALPERGAGVEMDAAVLRALRAMRFAAKDAEAIDWAWATVRW